MNCSLRNFKKRKSFITLIKKNSHKSYPSEIQHHIPDPLTPEAQWKSLALDKKHQSEKDYSSNMLPQRRMSVGAGADKQNFAMNRGLIKIKPRKYMGSCHLLWCKQGQDKNSLIRLQRENLTSCDFE